MAMVSLLFLCGSNVPAQNLFSDTFTGKEGTRPANWIIKNAPEAGFWFIKNGQFSTGNGDDILDGGGYSYALIDSPGAREWTDYSIQCSFWIYQANGQVMLIARWQDERNHYRGVLETYKGGRILKIEKVFNGVPNALVRIRDGEQGVVLPKMENGTSPADARLMKFSVVGNRLQLSLGDSSVIEAEDSTFTKGTAGMGEWYHYAYFDDVIVDQLSPGAIPSAPSAPVSSIPTVFKEGLTPSIAPSAPGTIYRILIGENLPNEDMAKNLRNKLISWGYTPVEVFQTQTGFDVYLGAFLSQSEASSAKAFLEEEGFSPRDIVALSGDKAADVKKQATASQKVFRVMASEFGDQVSADRMRNSLEGDGYFPVDVEPAGNKIRVFIGTFNNMDEASKLAEVLRRDGYEFSKAVEVDASQTIQPEVAPSIFPETATASVSEQPVIPTSIMERQDWLVLTPEEREEVTNTIMAEKAIRSGDVYAQQILELKKKLDDLTNSQKEIVLSIRKQAEEEKNQQIKIAELFSKSNKARDRGEWDDAILYLNQVAELDPNNASVELKKRTIENLRRNIKFDGQKIIEEQTAERIKRATEMAKKLENEEKYEAAIAQWNMVRNLANHGSFDYNQANSAIGRIDGIMKQLELQNRKREQKWQYTIYGIAGLSFVLLIVILWMALKSKKHDRELYQQLKELTLKPRLELMEGKGPSAIEDLTGDSRPGTAESMSPSPLMEEEAPPPPSPEEPPMPPPPEEVPVPLSPEAEAPFDLEPEPLSPDLAPVDSTSTKSEIGEPVDPFAEMTPEQPVPVAGETETNQDDSMFQTVSLGDLENLQGEETSRDITLEGSRDKEDVKAPVEDVGDLLGQESAEEEFILAMGSEPSGTGDDSEQSPAAVDVQQPPVEPETVAAPVETPPKEEPPVQKEEPPVKEVEPPEPLPVGETKAKEVESEPPEPEPAPPPEPEPPVEEKKVEVKPEPVVARAPALKMEEPKPEEPELKTPEPEPEPAPAPQPVPAVAGASPADNIVYEQSFDEETCGEPPLNWKGDYNYASLKISDDSPAPNSKRCVVFDKEKGAGSAFYSCHFPDITGEVGIEFDLRCDNKNKYLLGFYIEKDEDYRYSVHTVVQYIDSGKQETHPSLRIQGKPVKYNWGEWRHIKYHVNLVNGTVDGYVDGDLIADKERLASCPSSLNTISIRDNLATVGKLMIDNIKIYKA